MRLFHVIGGGLTIALRLFVTIAVISILLRGLLFVVTNLDPTYQVGGFYLGLAFIFFGLPMLLVGLLVVLKRRDARKAALEQH